MSLSLAACIQIRMNVNVFIPCYIDQLAPETAFNMIRVLRKAGCVVEYNPGQACCGQPAYNAGYWDEAKKMGQRLLRELPPDKPTVVPSASCVGMVKTGYNDLFTNTVDHNRCRTVQGQIYEISEFLVHVLSYDYFGAELDAKAVYHDSCSALRTCGIRDEPRQLLQKVAGLELIEAPDAEVCCGFGGTFSYKFPELSSAMAEQKVLNALDLGADLIISTDSGCLLHLQSYIDQKNLPIRTMHLADVLCQGWPNI